MSVQITSSKEGFGTVFALDLVLLWYKFFVELHVVKHQTSFTSELPAAYGAKGQMRGQHTTIITQVGSLTQFYSLGFSLSRISVKSVFLFTNTHSRFVSSVLDGVLQQN